MILNTVVKFRISMCRSCRIGIMQRRFVNQDLEDKYTNVQKERILQVINESDSNTLSGYNLTKGRLKNFSQWKGSNGQVKNLSDVELIEGFNEKSAAKLFDSILEGPSQKVEKGSNKIKGQILQPNLSESVIKSCKTVLAVYVSVNSVCWTLIDRSSYEVVEWQYRGINYPESKRLLITDILEIASSITQKLPQADIYVMKAEATTLRAAGSDPNNPKVIAVNLQKAQLVAMIVALINARHNSHEENEVSYEEVNNKNKTLKQRVYFLRPSLPFRLYGTLVGNEKVATDQTVEMLLKESTQRSTTFSHVYVPHSLQSMFRNQKDLQKDMLGHCLLLGLTFMDLCIYKNQASIDKLIKRSKD